jgi:hypothetical protein
MISSSGLRDSIAKKQMKNVRTVDALSMQKQYQTPLQQASGLYTPSTAPAHSEGRTCMQVIGARLPTRGELVNVTWKRLREQESSLALG